jgi:hypothetical protein
VTPSPSDISERAQQYFRRSRVQIGLSRAAATASARQIDPANPDSWEFSAFSAAGEDGIVDYLTRRMRDPEYTFLEIGSSDGVANNTAWLAIARKWQGVMVEADAASVRRARSTLGWFNPLVELMELMVSEDNLDQVLAATPSLRPDVFSLDVDSVDYYLARALLDRGLRPRLCVVEYNSAFGPERRCTVNPALVGGDGHRFYDGVSISGWRSFFASHGYRFVGVERSGVNAFFVDEASFEADFLAGISPHEFRENLSQMQRAGGPWQQQLEQLNGLELVEIP